jgi:hypothetical protein
MIPWLSAFLLNPAMAFGAAAATGPIIIHLLSRRRFKTVRWAAMDFLLEAQRQNRRRIKLEQWLLLALRCLAVFLIVAMIARPFLESSAASMLLSAGARTQRFILLDDSFSMGCRSKRGEAAGQTVFARAVETTRSIARALSEKSPRDTLALVSSTETAEPLHAMASISQEHLLELEDRLGSLRATQRAARMPEAIASLARQIEQSAAQGAAVVYIVSDFQTRDWLANDTGSTSGPPAALMPLLKLTESGRVERVLLIDVSAPSPQNIAVTGIACSTSQVVAGLSARFEVSVSNYSDLPAQDVELSISIGASTLPPVLIPRIPSRQTVHEGVDIAFPDAGSHFVRVALAGKAIQNDDLALDNESVGVVDVAPAVQILIVDGQPSADPYRDEVFLLKTALRPEGSAASGNELTVIDDADQLDSLDLAPFHVVVLANVRRVGTAGIKSLEQFVRSGGGLVIFGGSEMELPFYNDQFYRTGQGLLPATIKEIVQTPGEDKPVHIKWIDREHALLRPFAGKLGEVLRTTRFYEYPVLAMASAASMPVTTTRSADEPRVIAKFDDEAESPAMVVRDFGRGTCLFVATTADQEWNDWAANFSYLPFMLELVQVMARKAPPPAQAVVGASLICRADSTIYRDKATLRTPEYPLVAELDITARKSDGRVHEFEYAGAETAGLYEFNLTQTTGEKAIQRAAVTLDPTESNLASVGGQVLLAEGSNRLEYIRDEQALLTGLTGKRHELWWPLLLAAAAVLMTEQTLAWWFGRRA